MDFHHPSKSASFIPEAGNRGILESSKGFTTPHCQASRCAIRAKRECLNRAGVSEDSRSSIAPPMAFREEVQSHSLRLAALRDGAGEGGASPNSTSGTRTLPGQRYGSARRFLCARAAPSGSGLCIFLRFSWIVSFYLSRLFLVTAGCRRRDGEPQKRETVQKTLRRL